jgi:hypothetical protein
VSVLYCGYEGSACESTLRRKNLCGGSVAHWRRRRRAAAAEEEEEEGLPAETDSGGLAGRPGTRLRIRRLGVRVPPSASSKKARCHPAAGLLAVLERREPRAQTSCGTAPRGSPAPPPPACHPPDTMAA